MRGVPRRPLAERLWAKVREGSVQPHMATPCQLWTGAVSKKHGYGTIGSGGHDGKTHYVHVAAFELRHGPVPPGMKVLHECDVKLCVLHLYAGTHADNMRDRQARGRTASGNRNGARTKPEAFPKGSARGHAKLTEDQVRALRRARAEGTTQVALAEKYGVSSGLVCRILQRQIWTHI
jgi:hypothetical protein